MGKALTVIGNVNRIAEMVGHAGDNAISGHFQDQGVKISPEFELATSDMLIQFAKKSLGIASVVRDFAKSGIATGELFELQFAKKIPPREFCVVLNDRVPMTAAAEALLNFLDDAKDKTHK